MIAAHRLELRSEIRGHELLEAEHFQAQWAAFLKKTLVEGPERFAAALSALGDFLSPVFSALMSGRIPSGEWAAPGPWRK